MDNGVKHIYLKYGGRTRAKDEFYSVKPRNVRIEYMVEAFKHYETLIY